MQRIFVPFLVTLALVAQDRPSPFGPPAETRTQPRAVEEPVDQPPAEPTPGPRRPGDLYAEELRRARQLEGAWLTRQGTLEEQLAELPACSSEAHALIRQARTAAKEALAAREVYYQRHLQHLRETLQQAESRRIERLPDRSDIEASLAQARRELSDAERRRGELVEAVSAARLNADGSALAALDSLIARLRREVELTEEALRLFEDAQTSLANKVRWGQQQARHVQGLMDVVNAEKKLWQNHYDSRQFQTELRCHQSRPPVYEFPTRTPSNLGGIR